MTRFRAFLIHLGISFVIFLGLSALVLYVWYPGFFFTSDGGWQGIRIIALVDIVLGPTLTLIVFNPAKPASELTRDLSVIGVIQAACLVAGIYVVHAERPLALVYVDGHFFSLSADDYREAGVAVPDLGQIPGRFPKRVMIDLPDDPTLQSEVRRGALEAGRPLRTLAERYVPFELDRIDVAADALPPEALQKIEAKTGDLAAWRARHGGTLDDYAFFRFGARYQYLVLGVERDTGEIVGLLDTELRLITNEDASSS